MMRFFLSSFCVFFSFFFIVAILAARFAAEHLSRVSIPHMIFLLLSGETLCMVHWTDDGLLLGSIQVSSAPIWWWMIELMSRGRRVVVEKVVSCSYLTWVQGQTALILKVSMITALSLLANRLIRPANHRRPSLARSRADFRQRNYLGRAEPLPRTSSVYWSFRPLWRFEGMRL